MEIKTIKISVFASMSYKLSVTMDVNSFSQFPYNKSINKANYELL